MRRRGQGRMTAFRAGILAVLVIALFTYFGFTKANPFADPYEFSAVFENTDNVKPRSPIRIAGVDVGKVKKVEPLAEGETGARVTFEVQEKGLPIHEDATLKVRARIFLEGNKFVDLRPGSPTAPELEKGGTIPMQQTSGSVAFGDVLTALQSDTREDLQVFLKEYSKGLEGKGARGFNQSIRYWESAYRNSSLANDATLGTEPTRDLRRVLRGQARTFAALAEDEEALKGLVTNLNITTAAFAREDAALQASVPALRDTLRAAQPALGSLNAALPTLRVFSREALPGVRTSAPTLRASLPFMRQASALFRRRELRGLARVLRRYVPSLVRLNRTTIPVLEQGRTLSACTNNVLVPFANAGIPHPDFPELNNQPFRLQAPRGLTGLSGESRLSDANLSWFHGMAVPAPGGATNKRNPSDPNEPNIRPAAPPDSGRQPPPHRPDVPCETQEPPNLNAPGGTIAQLSGNAPPRASLADMGPAMTRLRRNMPAIQRELARRQRMSAKDLEKLRQEGLRRLRRR